MLTSPSHTDPATEEPAPPPAAPPGEATGGPGEETGGAAADEATPRRRPAVADIAFVVVVGALVAFGAWMRIWILGHDAMNSDEAVVGLVARGIVAGHQTAFVWHQAYGGVEPYLVAGVFAVFGASPLTLNLVPAVLAAVVAVLTWCIGRRIFPERAAVAAAVVAWVWPESVLFNSTREYGYHEAALVAGMVVLLFTVRIIQRRPSREHPWVAWYFVDWAVLGLAGGLGWWASPEIAYFLIPAVLALLGFGLRRPLAAFGGGVLAGAVFFFIGFLPWLIAGVDDRWATIRTVRGSRHSHTFDFRLGVWFHHTLPLLYGLQVEGTGRWLGGAATGPVLYGLALAVTGVALVVLAVWFPLGRLLVVFCLAFPFVYAAFPTSWFWQDGRYGVFLTPVLALVLMGAVSAVERPWRAAGRTSAWRRTLSYAGTYALLALAVVSTWVAFATTFQVSTPGQSLTGWHANLSPTVTALAARLEHDGVYDAYADYWVAYDLQFISGDRIDTFPIAQDKDPAEGRRVTSARRAAWIFVATTPAAQSAADTQLGAGGALNPPGVTEAPLIAWLDAHHIGYRRQTVGPFVVVAPDRNVTPADINAPGTELG